MLKVIKVDFIEWVVKFCEWGVVFGFGMVLVGDDFGLYWYVFVKYKDCVEIGIVLICVDLFVIVIQVEVEVEIDWLNVDFVCTGFIVQ